MTDTITRRQLVEICDNAEFDAETTLRTDYSGRGMYGAVCVAFTVPRGPASLLRLGAAIQRFITESEEYDTLDYSVEQRLLGSNVSTDNMGHDTVVYFPGLQVAED